MKFVLFPTPNYSSEILIQEMVTTKRLPDHFIFISLALDLSFFFHPGLNSFCLIIFLVNRSSALYLIVQEIRHRTKLWISMLQECKLTKMRKICESREKYLISQHRSIGFSRHAQPGVRLRYWETRSSNMAPFTT